MDLLRSCAKTRCAARIGLCTVDVGYAWDFMHLRDEKVGLRRAVVWTGVFLIGYLSFILLVEGNYIYDIYKAGFVKWEF